MSNIINFFVSSIWALEIEPFNLNASEVHAHEHFFLYDTALWQVKPFTYQKSFEIFGYQYSFYTKIALVTVAFVSPPRFST